MQEAWLRMTEAKKRTINACMTIYLWTLGATRSTSSITVYRTVLAQFVDFLYETNCAIP